jgi:uncharacterized NAD-dependent epimerase/dehydratase family protein
VTGLDAAWIATGQTGIMVGAHCGVVVDRVPADFAAGVLEKMVRELGDRDVVFVEGQTALTYRAYGGVTLSIGGNLAGRRPAHRRPRPSGPRAFESQTVPRIEEEEASVGEALSDAAVIAISTWGDPEEEAYDLDCPAVNLYQGGGPTTLLDIVADAPGRGDAL